MKKTINKHILEHKKTLDSIINVSEAIEDTAILMINCLRAGGTIFWCGNGGSASDSQHLAGELVGRFLNDRRPLRSISLNADSAVMTCIVNDYGYEHIFSRQVQALGTNKDILVGISTSGNSLNVLNAFKVAKNIEMKTIGLLGKGGGQASKLVSNKIVINSDITARIQEMHILVGHILCDLIEEGLNLK